MTYLQFHLAFILPAIVGLGVVAYVRRKHPRLGRDPVWALPLLAAVAFLYTTPWDNYLVYREVWMYGADRVLGTIGYVPIEEYAFFLLQPVLTGLWYFVVRSFGGTPKQASVRAGRVLVAVYAVLAAVGIVCLVLSGHLLYLGLVLGWACPVLAGMAALAGPKLVRWWRVLLAAVAPPTLYLWIADRVAIGAGIWDITDATRTGIDLFGLPIEEAAFFLVTNLLVVQGLLLFLDEDADGGSTARA